MITLQSEVNRELLPEEADENIRDLSERTAPGWKDLTAALLIEGVPTDNKPTYKAFGASGLRMDKAFGVDDYAFCEPFHINHDIKVGSKAYVHIHWTTSGSNTNPVKWEFQVSRAKGHDQQYFSPEASYFVEQAPNEAWRHMVAEVADEDALTLLEPDEIILVTVRRVTNGAVDNTDDVFGLTVDFHYESDRDSTPNKVPNFYS